MNADTASVFIGVYRRPSAAIHIFALFGSLAHGCGKSAEEEKTLIIGEMGTVRVEVTVQQDHRPVAVIKTPQGPGRKISECIALAKAHEETLSYAPSPDPDFARGVQAPIDAPREPFSPPPWD